MGNGVADWAAAKLAISDEDMLEIVNRTPEGFLVIRSINDGYEFLVAVLGIQNVIQLSDVESLFTGDNKPQLVINVPSKTLWSGAAIEHIHAQFASFGSLGDVYRASRSGNAGAYRNKAMSFFIKALQQHSNVSSVSYVYDRVFYVNRYRGESLTIAVIDAYNMSAEDVRNAKASFGNFDVAVKATSYGSITNLADAAAESMGAQVVMFGDLMRLLAK